MRIAKIVRNDLPKQDQGSYDLCLKEWFMKSRTNYNMVKDWSKLVKDNKLAKGDVIQVWSFRVRSNLCFAVVEVVKMVVSSQVAHQDSTMADTELRLGLYVPD